MAADLSQMPEPEEPGGVVKLAVYRDQCDKFKGKKRFAKRFRIEISLKDDGDRTPTTPEEEALRKVKVEYYDPWVISDVKEAQQLAIQKKDKKSKGGGSADEEDYDEDAMEAASNTEGLLRAHPGYTQAVSSICVNFVERSILSAALPMISAKKDWGTYNIEQLRLSDVTMDPDQLVVDCSGSQLTVTLGSILGSFKGFQWIFDRVKLPKASDSCVADAAVIFSVVFATPVEIVDESVFVAGKTTVSVHVDNLSLEVQGGKHPWVYKRMNAAFEANISESVEQALQDCSRVTKASQELGLRIAHATEVVNRQQQQQASGGGRK